MLKATWKSLLARKLRLIMSAFAIVLGVAFVAGSLIFTDMLSKTFDNIFTGSIADVNVQAKGQSGDTQSMINVAVSGADIDKIKTVDGVASAEGVVQSMGVYLLGSNGKPVIQAGPPALGFNVITGKAYKGQPGLNVVTGSMPTSDDQVAVDQGSLDKGKYAVGDTVKFATTGAEPIISKKIVGVIRWGEGGSTGGASYAVLTTHEMQRLFMQGKDEYNGAWVVAKSGVDPAQLAPKVQAVLPATLEAVDGKKSNEDASKSLSTVTNFMTTFLLVFAGISLVVGTFLIVNTFSIIVAQRGRELALFRALGASRGQVRRSVLIEAFVVGVVGATVGLLIGMLLALGIRAIFANIGLDMGGQGLIVAPRTIIASYAVGILVTMLAAYLPARKASSVPPVAAMTGDVMTGEAGLGRRAAIGLTMTALGLAALLAGLLVSGLPQPVYFIGLGALLAVLGVAMASPILGKPVLSLLGALYRRLFGAVGQLAQTNAERNPRRTAATASALMIGLALVTAMAILGRSASASIESGVKENLRSDFQVSSINFMGFSPAIAEQIRAVPGVAKVYEIQYVDMKVGGKSAFSTAISKDGFDKIQAQKLEQGNLADFGLNTVLLDDKARKELGTDVGKTLDATINGKQVPIKVVGLYSSGTDGNGMSGPILTVDTPRAAGTLGLDYALSVETTPGADKATVRTALDKATAELPLVKIMDQQEFADNQTSQVQATLNMIYGLLALAIIIAVLGIINTLALSVIERTREIGLLRAVGLRRGQLTRMIVLESVVIALLGSVLGIGLGLIFGAALQRSLADQGLNVLSIPWGTLVIFLVVAGLVGVLAALWPSLRASRLNVLQAITTE